MVILKMQILTILIIISTNCLGSEDRPRLTRSASGTFYTDNIAITPHEAARIASPPLNVDFSKGRPQLTLNGVAYNLSMQEYMDISRTQELQGLMSASTTHLRAGHLVVAVSSESTVLARELLESEKQAKEKLIKEQREKIANAKAAIAAAGGKKQCTIQ